MAEMASRHEANVLSRSIGYTGRSPRSIRVPSRGSLMVRPVSTFTIDCEDEPCTSKMKSALASRMDLGPWRTPCRELDVPSCVTDATATTPALRPSRSPLGALANVLMPAKDGSRSLSYMAISSPHPSWGRPSCAFGPHLRGKGFWYSI